MFGSDWPGHIDHADVNAFGGIRQAQTLHQVPLRRLDQRQREELRNGVVREGRARDDERRPRRRVRLGQLDEVRYVSLRQDVQSADVDLMQGDD